MRSLSLERTGKEVSISGIKSKDSQQTHPMAKVTLVSEFTAGWKRDVTVASLDEVIRQLPLQEAHSVKKLQHIRNLALADDQFDQPGQIELLLGQNVWRHIFLDGRIKGSEEDHPEAWLTVFGWTILGSYNPNSTTTSQPAITHVVASIEENRISNKLLARFFELEEPSLFETAQSPTEMEVEAHYKDTHQRSRDMLSDCLKLKTPPSLAESKTQAINRAKANERSLIKKGKLPSFQEVMQEYVDLGHAQEVNVHLHHPQTTAYYMPVHSVFKDSSTTTKTRAVFDASAKTTTQHSLNDILAVGPTLHPTIDQILLRFRGYAIALSSDISKMCREVLLHPEDRALHRFIWKSNQDEEWKEFEMTRVTFGVAASPYLAVKTLQQAAEDHGKDSPVAQWHSKNSFYVDDLLGGADTPQEALKLYKDLCSILSKASFSLRKWRSNSKDVLKKIPVNIQESLPTQQLVDQHSATYPKALGVAWDSREDTMYTSINLPDKYNSTKRGIVGDIARTFDVLGWISPVILPMKILYRDLWQAKLDWDDEVDIEHRKRHRKWREELHILKEVRLPRHYFNHRKPCSIQLHGFSDASKEAYGAVIFIRATYPTGPPTVELVVSKSKVTPLAARSIPQLELCGANLLAKLMTTTRKTLKVPISDVYAYTDSTVVLAWLDGKTKRYCIYSANRISSTVNFLPTKCWRHVPTQQNPADAASRGLSAVELQTHHLWWHGPPWLKSQPLDFPPQPTQSQINKLKEVEAKPEQAMVLAVVPEDHFEVKFNSYGKLVKVFCWMRRFINLLKKKVKEKNKYLTTAEGQDATNILISRSQGRAFPQEVKSLKATPPQDLSPRSKILVLRPRMDDSGLLRVGGRFKLTDLHPHQKHSIIIAAKDCFTQLLFYYYHLLLGHCGPSTLLTHASNVYHVVGGRKLARSTCSKCIICRKAAVKASSQLLGQLPPSRVEPTYVFFHTGMDYAGPFLIRQGHTRRPVHIEAYLVCFVTKAVHLELVSDQTTEVFLAALDRFIDRRGLPLHLYSDNGPNYTGARNQLSKFYGMIASSEFQNAIQSYSFNYQITWHNIPQRAPHFGGLWEAAVKAAKYHLKRVVGRSIFTFEELSTICCNVESFMNSRPLGPVTSHDVDGLSPLTPAHFLLGRAARSYPKEQPDDRPTPLQRWERCKLASHQFWIRWSNE